jgi:hypothetical protein
MMRKSAIVSVHRNSVPSTQIRRLIWAPGRRLPGLSRKSPRNLHEKMSQVTSLSSRSLLANSARAAAIPDWRSFREPKLHWKVKSQTAYRRK